MNSSFQGSHLAFVRWRKQVDLGVRAGAARSVAADQEIFVTTGLHREDEDTIIYWYLQPRGGLVWSLLTRASNDD